MADLTVTPARLRIMESIDSRNRTLIADADIAKGDLVYIKANGRAGLARGNAVGTAKVVGFATTAVKAGKAFEAHYFGPLVGLDLSGVAYGATLYLSAATAGKVADTRPATSTQVVVALGTVQPMTDVAGTKFLFVDIPQNLDPVAIA
jgi:hypothetical protein